MFEATGLERTDHAFADLAAAKVNGRHIRNPTRLAKLLHPEGRVRLEELRNMRHTAVNLTIRVRLPGHLHRCETRPEDRVKPKGREKSTSRVPFVFSFEFSVSASWDSAQS
jgi:hypothetical protein